jgi:hypothetical protein
LLSRTAKSGNEYGIKRVLSIFLSGVLAFTLLQAFPATSNASAPLGVDLIARADDTVDGESVLLGESNLRETSPSTVYRLDIVPECGLLDHIDDISVAGITDIMGSPISWSAQPENANFVGTPEKLEQVLDNLRIIREREGGEFGQLVDCPSSQVLAYLVEELEWSGNNIPQGSASYQINDSYQIPSMTTFGSNNQPNSPRLNVFSDGFEVEWDEYLGATGYTPAGFTVRYRTFDGSERGPWNYVQSADGRYQSLLIEGLTNTNVQYEFEAAPTVITCDSEILFGKFKFLPMIGQVPLDQNAESIVGQMAQTTGREVVSQCLPACVPTETVEFDGDKLATVLKFTNTVACTWTIPSNFASGTVDAYIIGGGGGGGAAGGGGGGGGGFETYSGLPVTVNDTWSIQVGSAGLGAELNSPAGSSGTRSSLTYPGSNGNVNLNARGGGGGGSKDQLGVSSADLISGGNGINTGATPAMAVGGSSSSGNGQSGTLSQETVFGKALGAGGRGAFGLSSGTSFIEGTFASGGGGGAVCVQTDGLNYSGGESQNNGTGGDCRDNNQDGLQGGNALDNSGGGGGGGASDLDFGDGAGGDGADGVIYIVHTEDPLARYIPSGCEDISGVCTSWEATNGNQNLTATVTGAPVITSTGNPARNGSSLQDSISVVQGGPSDAIDFPVLLTNDYTFFSVARYNEKENGKYRRIFDGKVGNWLSGFHSGVSGVAYHGDEIGWIGGIEQTEPNGFNWVLSTDSKSMYRSNGIPIDHPANSAGAGPVYVSINNGSFGLNNQLNTEPQTSDFQVADVLFFDRELSQNEYIAVETYLSERYGICLDRCLPPAFDTASSLTGGDVNQQYSASISATSPYNNSLSYAILDLSNFPQGLSFDTNSGSITGAPEISGSYFFTIEVTDTVNGQSVSQVFSISVNDVTPPPQPPVFTTTSPLLSGETGTPYLQTIEATSANSISYSVEAGELPSDLSLNSSTGEISGTPSTAGVYTFVVEATDTVNGEIAQREFSITINSPLPDPTPVGCEDYSEAAFVPDNFWLDSNGYPIGCDITGQDSVTPVVTDNPATENVVESWSQRFNSRVDLDYFNLRNGWICDDCSIGLQGEIENYGSGPGPGPGPSPSPSSSSNYTGLPLGFSFNYYGKTYNSVFVNSNGSLTFGAPSGCYNETLTRIMRCGGASGTSAIVAYGVDLDNRHLNPDVWGDPLGPSRHTEFFYWGKTTTEDGKRAFVATWMNSPGYCDSDNRDELDSELGYEYEVCDFDSIETDPFSDEFQQTLSTFQIVLIDQSSEGGATGDADVIINYGSMQDSQNGYTSCDILQGETGQDDPACQPTSDRYLAVGLGSTQVNAENSELWDSSVTSLEAVHPIIPGATLLYNGVDASLVGDLAPLALSAARQFEGSIPGRFVYEFRANSSPDVATPPSTPVAILGSATESSMTVTIEPPSDNGGAPVLTYGIEYRITGETDWTPVPANIQYAEPDVTFEVGGLSPATSYEVRVTANNGIGDSEPTETLSLSTTAIQGAPETPAFRSSNPFEIFDEGEVSYSWDALAQEPDSYAVRYRPATQGNGNSLPWVTKIFNSGSEAFNNRAYSTPILNPDTQYEFQISARNASGSSAWSASSLVTTSPASDRIMFAAGIVWNGYGSEISTAYDAYDSGLVYDGALKVFIGDESRSTAVQVLCDQSTISNPGFDVGVEGKQGHYEWETAETRVQGGYTVTCAPETITLSSGDQLVVSLSRFFFTDSPWTRVMIDVTNLEATEIGASVWLESKLQPDSSAGNTTYEVSSSASDPTSPETGDRWIVTGDNKESGMVVAHVFGQPLDDPNVSNGVNQDGGDLMLSEFGLDLPGTTSEKSNSARLAWFDGIVQYDATSSDAEELADNYSSAVATAKSAAENFTKVKSQLTDTYPRFVPPTLTNFRTPDQVRVSPGVFNDLKASRISGQNPSLDLSLNFSASFLNPGQYSDIPVTYKISNSAKLCIDNSLNESIFVNDGNIEVENTGLLVNGTQAELNCFIQGLTFSISTPPIGADSPGSYGYLFADLTELVSQRGLSEQGTKLIFDGFAAEQTLIDVEAGNATWRGVGTGINDVETRSNRNAYDEGSLEVYWIPNVNADPLSEGIKIYCPQDADTRLEENLNAEELTCESDLVLTPDGDLEIQISRYFATSDPWQQLELNVTNNETNDLSGALAYRLDLGSDENTEIEMTSDGDLNLESADSWFITSDDGQRTDPVLLHYVGFESGQKITQGTDADVDKIWVKTPLRVDGETQVTKRYLEGVVDAPRGQVSDAVVVAMKAADQVLNQKFRIPTNDFGSENLNILDTSLPTAVNEDRDLPALRTVYECRDYAHNVLEPIALQPDGKVIGCDAFDPNQEEGPGGPGGNFGGYPINDGLFPGDQSLEENERRDAWSRNFSSVFPNAQPRLGWACDSCIVTREGVTNLSDAVPDSDFGSDYEFEIPSGLPLGFSMNLGQTDSGPTPFSSPSPSPTPTQSDFNYDSIRITPHGVVQVHDSRNPDENAGHYISAFGNLAMSNGVLQGNWEELPEYDFFYWGRTVYQGRLAFVVTWVKIPTVEFQSSNGLDYGVPKPGLEPTSVQLMLVSDSYLGQLDEYLVADPEDRPLSNVDLIWNFSEIQSEDAVALYGDAESASDPLQVFSGTWQFMSGHVPLFSDEMTEADSTGLGSDLGLGVASESCDTDCVVTGLLSNKLQSPINGRYVLGYRDYFKNQELSAGAPRGLLAPAAPRAVEVSRNDATVASLSWKAPVPWVLGNIFDVEAEPIYGYRIEYAVNGRFGESSGDVYPPLNQEPLTISDLTISGNEIDPRYTHQIDDLLEGEQYTFRVYATYVGLNFPDPDDPDFTFDSEIRGVPSLADERHDSDLLIETAAETNVLTASEIAQQIAGDVPVTSATVNGSSYIEGITSKSIGTFEENGSNAIGIESGIVMAPLLDVRTFERGSGVTPFNSKSQMLNEFSLPQDRARYEGINTEFDAFLQSQESWVPNEPAGAYEPVCDSDEGGPFGDACANGMTVLQFDVTPTDDFLKFEYALAGTETEQAGFVYSFPDGFGLFVDGIDQEHSCALVPQVNGTTPEQRFLTTANALEARLARYVPYDSDLHAATITSTMTCSSDVSSFADSETPVTVTMVIANANDQGFSPAVFIKGNSIRFEATSFEARDIPEARRNSFYTPIVFTTSGTEPSSWSATGLPAGMSINSTGELTLQGTPTQSGSFDFTLEALDENNETLGTQAFTIRVVDVPDLLSCPNQNTETTLLDVVVLSKFEESQTAYRIGTDVTGSDTGISNILCRSPYLTTTFFDGANGTSTAWEDALDGNDVLVIPSTSDDLAGSNLMSHLALEEAIKPWMHDGGRVILTDGTNHVQELAELIDVDPINFETRTVSDSIMSRNDAAQALPTSLPMSETNNSDISLVMNEAGDEEFEDISPNRFVVHLYSAGLIEGNDYLRQTVATNFGVNRGEVSFLSSSFATDRTNEWDKILLQSIYGTKIGRA